MLTTDNQSDIRAINNVLESFTSLEVTLDLISKGVLSLRRVGEIVVFDSRGKFYGQLSQRHVQSQIGKDQEPIVATYNGLNSDGLADVFVQCLERGRETAARFCLPESDIDTFDEDNFGEECKYLLEYVGDLWGEHPKARDAAARLPQHLLDELSTLCGKPWLPRVRHECLDWVTAWPGETKSETLGNEKVAGGVARLLINAAKRDPHEVWAEYIRLIDGYSAELKAVRPAAADFLQSTEQSGREAPLTADELAKPEAETPALSDRQYLILQSLLEMGAIAADTRKNTQAIATKAEGSRADANSFKEPIADLKQRGFIDTKEGRGGGCWLTVSGKSVAEKL